MRGLVVTTQVLQHFYCILRPERFSGFSFFIYLFILDTCIRGLTRKFLMLLMPLLFFSVKRLLCYIFLVPGLSLGELPNLFVLDFLPQTSNFVHPFFAVKEKVVDVPYCVIFEYTSLPKVM
jgi:hypothetical protein